MRHLSCQWWIRLYSTFCYLGLLKVLRIKKITCKRKKIEHDNRHLTLLVITVRVSHPPSVSTLEICPPAVTHSLTGTHVLPFFPTHPQAPSSVPLFSFSPCDPSLFFSLSFLPLSTAIITSPIIAVTSEMIK